MAIASTRRAASALALVHVTGLLLPEQDWDDRLGERSGGETAFRASVLVKSRDRRRALKALERSGWRLEPDLTHRWRHLQRVAVDWNLSSRARLDHEGFTLELRWSSALRRLRATTLDGVGHALLPAAAPGPSGFLEPAPESLLALRDVSRTTPAGRGPVHPSALAREAWLSLAEGIRERWSLAREGFLPLIATTTSRSGDIEIRTPSGVFRPWGLSERLAATAIDSMPAVSRPLVVDVGTGSGLIALTIASVRPDATVIGSDVSPLAIRAARRNAAHAGLHNVRFWRGSLLDPRLVARRQISLIVSNIPSDPPGLPRGSGDPRHGLVGSSGDGLDLVRQLIDQAVDGLIPGGRLVLMLRPHQWSKIRGLAEGAGLTQTSEVASSLAEFVFYVLESDSTAGVSRIAGGGAGPSSVP